MTVSARSRHSKYCFARRCSPSSRRSRVYIRPAKIGNAAAAILVFRPNDDSVAVPTHPHCIPKLVSVCGVAGDDLYACRRRCGVPAAGRPRVHVYGAPILIRPAVPLRRDDDGASVRAGGHGLSIRGVAPPLVCADGGVQQDAGVDGRRDVVFHAVCGRPKDGCEARKQRSRSENC